MSKPGRWLKTARRPSAPSVVFAVVVQPNVEPCSSNERMMIRTFRRAYACVSYRSRGKWTAPSVVAFGTPGSLIDWIHERSLVNRRNVIVSPIASDALTLLRFWDYADSRTIDLSDSQQLDRNDSLCGCDATGFGIARLVLRGRPDIINYTDRGRRYVWCSAANWFADLCVHPGGSSNPGGGSVRGRDSPRGFALVRPDESVQVCCQLLTNLIDWWLEHATAPFAYTVGGLSMQFLRSYIGAKELLVHGNTDVQRLEREASYGERSSVWFVGGVVSGPARVLPGSGCGGGSRLGLVAGPATEVDVRSMHPHLLREREYPCKLLSYTERCKPSEPQALAEGLGVIACVTIFTRKPEYPYRWRDRVIFPTGTFTTVLTGPELLKLREDGEVIKCHRMATYRLGRPFVRCADALINMRVGARTAKDTRAELFIKLLSNALGGKLAQRCGRWVSKPAKQSERRWGEWREVNADTGLARRFRAVAGLCWEWVTDENGAGPHTACFAYLTAWGRLLMREIREQCPAKTVVSQDADGIWVLPEGYAALAANPDRWGDAAGQLRVKDTAIAARFFGPKHFWADGVWTLAGFHHPSVDDQLLTITDTFERNPVLQGCTGPPGATFSITRRSQLSPDTEGGEVAPDGWVWPRQLHMATD